MIEAARTPEMLVNFYQTIRRNNPEDSHLRKMSGFLNRLLHEFLGLARATMLFREKIQLMHSHYVVDILQKKL
jgi:hypothetical protein